MPTRRVALPAPTGPFAVGRTAFDWVDREREEVHASRPGGKREITVWIWYPAASVPGAAPAPYLPGDWAALGQAWGFDAARVRSHAVADAPVAPDQRRYPVLVFSPAGFPPLLFAATLEELASHGHVVAGVNHTYETMPLSVFADGRTVPANPAATGDAWLPPTGAFDDDVHKRAPVVAHKAADLRFALDQLGRLNAGFNPLAGRLDPSRIGALGFSLGGAAALETCRTDPRCRAVANLDGGLWGDAQTRDVPRPGLLVAAEHDEFVLPCDDSVRAGLFPSAEYCAAFRANAVGGWQAVHDNARPGQAALVRGARHPSFLDLPLLPLADGSPVKPALAAATIDPARLRRVVCDLLLAFFAAHLDGEGAPPNAPAHREIAYGTPAALFPAPPTDA